MKIWKQDKTDYENLTWDFSLADCQSIQVASSSSRLLQTSERNNKGNEQHTCECPVYYTIQYPNLSNSNLQDFTIIGLYTVRG